ncbi:hypothetical protein FKR81_10840 [Lentzea tibetensis]|uniref:Uncharacterized protein n=1 Tax=Lentzea tibetensis TaxID=2591470 RepID=A0A563EWN9_9PSEU|nr:hypothetical protein [Lentzea tibetensis]TWP52073.1 hypothetical protein FKR81_10840 [Lentzea tibetensis]
MTVVGLDARLGALGVALGQLDDVRVELEDLEWSQYRATRAVLVFRDVHVNPPATVVASPMEFEVVIPAEGVPQLQRWKWLPLHVFLVDDALHVRVHRWLPPKVFPIPELPRGIKLTSLQTRTNSAGDSEFVLGGAAPVVRERLSVAQLVDLLSRLASSQSSSRSDTTSGISIWGT